MTTQNGPSTGTDMVLSPRAQQLQSIRDEMAPGAKPSAIVPRTFAEAQAMCAALASANLVPKAFRGAPADMVIVVMHGAELGIPPMASLRLFTTWDGVPRLMAEGVRAVILSHPEIEYFEPQSCSETSATWVGKRRGRPEKSATWTIERAKRARLTEKEVWQKYPEDMLNARASMQLGRMIAADLIAGMVSLEEARDGDFIEASFTETKAPAFVAPAPAGAAAFASAPAVVDNPPRGSAEIRLTATPDRPKAAKSPKADPAPPPTSSAGASGSAETASNGSSAPSTASTTQAASKLDAAIAKVEAKMADPTSAGSNTGPTPSAESAPASTAPTTSGAAPAEDDSGFGAAEEQPADKLAEFRAWLLECKTQRDLQAGLGKWRTWSQEQAKAGDTTFSKSGANTVAMQDAYGKRKGEVPA